MPPTAMFIVARPRMKPSGGRMSETSAIMLPPRAEVMSGPTASCARPHEVRAGAEERLSDDPHEGRAEHRERREDRRPRGREGEGAEREGRDGIRPDVDALDEEEDPELTDGEQLAVGLHSLHPDESRPGPLIFRTEAKHGDLADLGRPAGAEPLRRVPAHRDGRRPQRP